jgi:hypothetical protein
MVWVDEARKYGFTMELNEAVMRSVLNGAGSTRFLATTAANARSGIESHVRATASMRDAENYVASLIVQPSTSDAYNFEFGGPYGLGNRHIVTIGVPSGKGNNPAARPPLMTEARTHALTSVPGFAVDSGGIGEDIR